MNLFDIFYLLSVVSLNLNHCAEAETFFSPRYYCDYSGFRVKDKSFNPKNQLAAKKHKKHKEYLVLHDTNRLPNGEIVRNREAENLFFSLAINCFSFLTKNTFRPTGVKPKTQNRFLNHAAVSKSPSSIVKGGTHPSSRRIFELSTTREPVNLLTAPVNFEC